MIFIYKNAAGEINQHQIANFNCDGVYLGAHTDHGYITYRLDRIIEFIPDKFDDKHNQIKHIEDIPKNKVFVSNCDKKGETQVYFSLFSPKQSDIKELHKN